MANNSYQRAARKKTLLGISTTVEETKGDFKSSAIETGAALLIGGILGSLTGHLLGRHSLVAGVLATGTSLYLGSRLGSTFGIGMMAAGYHTLAGPQVNGLEGMEAVKERAKMFTDGLKTRLYLDKLIKPKETETAANGLGDVRYFVYPSGQQQIASLPAVDMTALERLEQQISDSAKQYVGEQQPHQVSGQEDSLEEHLI